MQTNYCDNLSISRATYNFNLKLRRISRKTPQGPNYSFIPWRGTEADAVRLDFMLLRSDQFKVPAAGIVADGPPTRNSDHLALWAELAF